MRPYRIPGDPGTEAVEAKPSIAYRVGSAWAWFWRNPDDHPTPLLIKALAIAALALVALASAMAHYEAAEKAERDALPCSAFANEPVKDVPMRCAPGCSR